MVDPTDNDRLHDSPAVGLIVDRYDISYISVTWMQCEAEQNAYRSSEGKV
jgi:hypothetical protein